MLENLKINKEFSETRSIEKIDIKLSPKLKYIIMQYQDIMDIENRTSWILGLIEKDISEKIESGFVVIH